MNVEDKPPSSQVNMGISARVFSPDGSLARRFKDIWGLWASDWDICPFRNPLLGRCYSVLKDFQEVSIGKH